MTTEQILVDRWFAAKTDPELICCWRRDPVLFAWDNFRFVPDLFQAETLAAMAEQPKPIALPAAKGAGKSALLAIGIWWRMACWPQVKGAATSVSGANLRDNLAAEIALWYGKSELMQSLFEISSDGIRAKASPKTWFLSYRSWPPSADENQLGETLAGTHADHTLYVIDEAGAVPEAIGRAAEGASANVDPAAGRTAMYWISGNTTDRDSLLGRVILRHSDRWWIKEVSGDPADPSRAPRISLQWAKDQIDEYGADDPFVMINVFARFPKGSLAALISEDLILQAQRRTIDQAVYAWAPRVLAYDVAQAGDDRIVGQRRQGLHAWPPRILRGLTSPQLAAAIAEEIAEFKPKAVFVDTTGGYGTGACDILDGLGFVITRVNFGAKSNRPDCRNKRTEMYKLAAEWLLQGGKLPNLPVYLELAATRKGTLPNGQLTLEPKINVKARLGYSPDVADAFVTTFAYPVEATLPDGLIPAAARPAAKARISSDLYA